MFKSTTAEEAGMFGKVQSTEIDLDCTLVTEDEDDSGLEVEVEVWVCGTYEISTIVGRWWGTYETVLFRDSGVGPRQIMLHTLDVPTPDDVREQLKSKANYYFYV